jgi:hypothetical protein
MRSTGARNIAYPVVAILVLAIFLVLLIVLEPGPARAQAQYQDQYQNQYQTPYGCYYYLLQPQGYGMRCSYTSTWYE